MTAAYMQILIHTMNNTLFPDVDPSSVAWTGPPPEIVIVQSLLYASLALSLLAAFVAMLGKQWVNRYLRNNGGSAAEKSRDRQRKLDGFKNWRFYLVIESLPVMLQLALLLLWCALSLYLWNISRTVAGVILAFALLGLASYTFFTIAATFHYHCPYQTPPSILTRSAIMYLTRSGATLPPLLQPLIASLPSSKDLRRSLGRLCFGFRRALESFRRGSAIEGEEQIPLANINLSPTPTFEAVPIDWEVCMADARCISWVLDSTTDVDVITSTVRFAADIIWYPEIAGAVSPYILGDLFFNCFLDGRVIPNKAEHATSIGMALCSVLSIRLCVEPENEGLRDICERILDNIGPRPIFESSKLTLVLELLRRVAYTPSPTLKNTLLFFLYNTPKHFSTTEKVWLSRMVLQLLWRWRCVWDPDTTISLDGVECACRKFMEGGDETPAILRTNSLLIISLCLGLQIDICYLFPPDNEYVVPHFSYGVDSSSGSYSLHIAISLFSRSLQTCIWKGKAAKGDIICALAAMSHLDLFRVTQCGKLGYLWINPILKSKYQDHERHEMCSWVVRLLGDYFYPANPEHQPEERPPEWGTDWAPPLLSFLSLNEKLCPATASTGPLPCPGFTALRILSDSRPPFSRLCATILPLLTSALSLTHPQQLRGMALNVFQKLRPGWFTSRMKNLPNEDLEKLLRAIGDPFQVTEVLSSQEAELDGVVDFNPWEVMDILIQFASSDPWRKHLRCSNFTTYEENMSLEENQACALRGILINVIYKGPEFLCTPAKIAATIRRLEELQCPNTAEVIIMRAWATDIIDAMDHDGWRLVGNETLRFYQTHGMGRLKALKQHIANPTTEEDTRLQFLLTRYKGTRSPYRVGRIRRPAKYRRPCGERLPKLPSGYYTDLRVSQVCQLRRLYLLFGCDPTPWREVVRAEEVDEEVDTSSRCFEVPVSFTDP